jgi:predicted nucleic acid-binding protein
VSAFFDTNIFVYAIGEAGPKRQIAQDLGAKGGVISVQVLNELTNVLRKKSKKSWDEISVILALVKSGCETILPLTIADHDRAYSLARRHNLPVYDALIIASAVGAGCEFLYTEDMQSGQRFGRLTIVNPFAAII